jgi:hypothetical protein
MKIVAMALVAGVALAGLGVAARTGNQDGATQTAKVIKAGKPVMVTTSGTSAVQ